MALLVFDFECDACSHVFHDLVEGPGGTPEECPSCSSHEGFTRLMSAPAVLTTIVPSYPGSKRVKAGYQHTHNRPAEKKDRQVSMYGAHKGKNNGA